MRFVESFIIIWVDVNLHPDNPIDHDTQHSRNILYEIVNTVQLFDTCEKCLDFIHNKIKDEKIFLIVSGLIGQNLIPQIEDDGRLDSIYIFCWNKSEYEQWATREQHHKVNGIFTKMEDLRDQLKEDIKHGQHELTPIQTLSPHTSKITDHLDASFMYSQLLKEILLSTNYDETRLEEEKNTFVEFCRNQYATNRKELQVIEEFKVNYNKPTPIWWYTRECFAYSMLNRALCAQDVEILMKMSFFICDLHRQLEQLHKTIDPNQVLTVYRGQGMLPTAFNRLQKHRGGLISFNNFLSTSTSEKVSLRFVKKALRKPDNVAILFEMTIDPSIASVPFASLDQLSYFEESEKEILFSMHTVFRIGEITPADTATPPRLWHVHLTSTNADDEQLHQLTEYMRSELSSTLTAGRQHIMNPSWRLGKLLVTMGEYDKALVIWEMILDKARHEDNLELIRASYYEIAEYSMVYRQDWNIAKGHFNKIFSMASYDDQAFFSPATDGVLKIYSAIRALFMREQLDEDEFHSNLAELLSKLISFYLDHSVQPLGPLDYQLIADRHNYIGWVRRRQGNLSKAWTNYERALELLREHVPPTHPRLALTYYHMGMVLADMKNHSCALDYFKKALDIQRKALQPHHPHLAESHFQLSITFEHLTRMEEALEEAKRTVEIGRHAFLPMKQPPMKQYREHLHRLRSIVLMNNELTL